jgi:hypothetical protein
LLVAIGCTAIMVFMMRAMPGGNDTGEHGGTRRR